MTQEFCTNNGYTPFENAVQEAIADLVSPQLAQTISTRVGTVHRADLAPQAGWVDVEAIKKEVITKVEPLKWWQHTGANIRGREEAEQLISNVIDYLVSRGYFAGAPVGGDELVLAAQAVIERWDTPAWKDVPATATFINRLRDALKQSPHPAISVLQEAIAVLREEISVMENIITRNLEGNNKNTRRKLEQWKALYEAARDGRD